MSSTHRRTRRNIAVAALAVPLALAVASSAFAAPSGSNPGKGNPAKPARPTTSSPS